MAHSLRTWAVVADGARIRIFLNVANGPRLLPVFGGVFTNPEAHGHARDLRSDRPGRSFESVGHARHAEEPRTDPHREAKRHFAKQICDFVEKGAGDGQFDQLVLIAPPQMLGDLRAYLGPKSAPCVAAEVDKDLTQLPEGELATRLHEALAA
jgi:protein required for attachment to host cells